MEFIMEYINKHPVVSIIFAIYIVWMAVSLIIQILHAKRAKENARKLEQQIAMIAEQHKRETNTYLSFSISVILSNAI